MNRLAFTLGAALLGLLAGFGGIAAGAKDRNPSRGLNGPAPPPPSQVNHTPQHAGQAPANREGRKRALEWARKRQQALAGRHRLARERMRANAQARDSAPRRWTGRPSM